MKLGRSGYKDLVNELKKGKDVCIYGNVGKRLAYSLGVNLMHFGGNGEPERAGKINIDGNVSSEMGMGMVSGTILCKGLGKDVLVKNKFDERKKHLILDDGIFRGTVAARCNCDALVTINGNAYNGTGLLMQKGTLILTDSKGFVGANLKDGVIFVKKKIKIASPVEDYHVSGRCQSDNEISWFGSC